MQAACGYTNTGCAGDDPSNWVLSLLDRELAGVVRRHQAR
jgi:hypothetical protein